MYNHFKLPESVPADVPDYNIVIHDNNVPTGRRGCLHCRCGCCGPELRAQHAARAERALLAPPVPLRRVVVVSAQPG
ncbi:hypothetical protein EVAR_90549_1 [Eumeta japonica]|uniref:Uncharacterized protein n=1 Tax=Eumeta variegata TaxID=151549 RepID=A0A4C2AGB3_EUMVA|nr:hypothetical protein EVAR_90549_1 [Eumeta japonica]